VITRISLVVALVLVLALALVACGAQAPTSTTVVANTAGPDARLAAAAACGYGEERWGTTCCKAEGRDEEGKSPGMVFLSCRGPQIGKPCRAKTDCDIACSCDDPDEPLGNHNTPQGPADGTTGAIGHCTGLRQIGVWMCDIDENGRVGHVIVD
jgi:hypothetical protein